MQIGFEWQRDTKGYRFIDARVPRQRRAGETILTGDPGRPARIVRLGGKLESYRPLASAPDLYRAFARFVRDRDTALEFIQQYGPLTRAGIDPDEGDDVRRLVEQAKRMDALMAAAASDRAGLAKRIGTHGMKLPEVDASLVVKPFSCELRMSLNPRSLLDALWLQCASRLSEGALIRECAQCGMWFEAGGSGMSRRRDAKFCCDEHRVIYNSLKRSKGEPDA
jgi:hypothetical protein